MSKNKKSGKHADGRLSGLDARSIGLAGAGALAGAAAVLIGQRLGRRGTGDWIEDDEPGAAL